MREGLIHNWNERVQPGDLVYHLGDFAMKLPQEEVEAIIRRLKGQKFLILGNHDQQNRFTERAKGFVQTTLMKDIKVEGQRIVLCHYAMKTWNQMHRGAWQLHGHSHGNLRRDYRIKQLDVGVDVWGYAPISFKKLKMEMDKHIFVPVDHHGAGS